MRACSKGRLCHEPLHPVPMRRQRVPAQPARVLAALHVRCLQAPRAVVLRCCGRHARGVRRLLERSAPMTAPTIIAFVVPGTPPSWKRKVVAIAKGKRTEFNDKDYIAARERVAWAMVAAVGPHRLAFQQSRLSLRLDLHYPDRRVRDADRALNLVLDAGKGLLWTDDAWTTFEGGRLLVQPSLDRKLPRMELVIERIGPKEAT